MLGQMEFPPDLAKLTAIVDWAPPQTALNLASFLGITGHFRDLIKGYSSIEWPITRSPQSCTIASQLL